MKCLRSLLVFGAILAAGAAHADVQLNCVSYSKEYDFKMTIGERSARVDVLRAEPESRDFTLEKGQSVLLSRESSQSPDWMIFEGHVQGEQTLGLNVNKQELQRPALAVHLFISSTWTSTQALAVQADCTK